MEDVPGPEIWEHQHLHVTFWTVRALSCGEKLPLSVDGGKGNCDYHVTKQNTKEQYTVTVII